MNIAKDDTSAHPAESATILVVEDSPIQAELLRRNLVAAGYAVLVASDGVQGLAMAQAQRPDAVVSDINMPLMDGYQMCDAIRKSDALKSMPVILLTMLSDPKDVIQGLKSGADGYLTKPYNSHSLLSRIESLLAAPATPFRGIDRRKMEVLLEGERYSVQVNNQRMLNLLVSTYENAVLQNRDLAATRQALEDLNAQLDKRVLEKTASLRESESRYHSLFDNMLEGLAYCRMLYENDLPQDFIYVDVNAAFEKLTGLRNVVGRKVSEVIPGIRESNPELFDTYARVASSGKPEKFEMYVKSLDIWFSVSAYSTQPEHFIAVFDNITERTKAAERIAHLNRLIQSSRSINRLIVRERDRDKLLQTACDNLVQEAEYRMVWIGVGEEGQKRVVPVAQAGYTEGYLDAVAITWDEAPSGQGPTGTALRTREVSIIQDIETDPRYAPWREAALKRGYRASAVFPLLANHTLYGALNVYVTRPNAFDAEEIALLDGVADDIAFALHSMDVEDRRKRSEQALVASEIRFRALIENASDVTAVIDQDGIISYISPSVNRVAGYDPDQLLGKNILEFVHPDDAQTAVGDIARLMRHPDEIHGAELRYRIKDGSWRFFETLSRNLLADAAVRGIVANMRDITERKQAERERERYAESLQQSLEETIRAVATTVEMRDPYTAGHQRRVAELAEAIGRELGLPESQVHGLRLAGIIHDLGKIQLPAEILSKPGRLSAIEFSLIKAHPQSGYEILKDVEFPWPVAQAILQHHERLDGSGYPNGLKGEQIMAEARIIAVADVVEAMASHRPYRPALGIDAALAEIERGKGTAFDATAVDACVKLFREGRFAFEA